MMEEGKKNGKKKKDKDKGKPEPCCSDCCNCDCKEQLEASKGEECCLCIPISTGMVLIEIVTMLYIIGLTIYLITQYDNEYIDTYYILMILCLELFLFISLMLLCTFDRSKSKSARTWSIVGIVLFIFTVIGITIWMIWYYTSKYKYEYVYHGHGNPENGKYTMSTKKFYICSLVTAQLCVIGLYL